jgi:hypothetical protein
MLVQKTHGCCGPGTYCMRVCACVCACACVCFGVGMSAGSKDTRPLWPRNLLCVGVFGRVCTLVSVCVKMLAQRDMVLVAQKPFVCVCVCCARFCVGMCENAGSKRHGPCEPVRCISVLCIYMHVCMYLEREHGPCCKVASVRHI